MAAAAVAPDWAALQQQLGKKASFEGACAALAAAPAHLADSQAKALLARCRTLLRARYSARPYWLAARGLFQAALPAAQASGDAAFVRQLEVSMGGMEQRTGRSRTAAACKRLSLLTPLCAVPVAPLAGEHRRVRSFSGGAGPGGRRRHSCCSCSRRPLGSRRRRPLPV